MLFSENVVQPDRYELAGPHARIEEEKDHRPHAAANGSPRIRSLDQSFDVIPTEGLHDLLLSPYHRHPHEGIFGQIVHSPAPGEEGFYLSLPSVLGAGAHAPGTHPTHEEVHMGGMKLIDSCWQPELFYGRPELTHRLAVRVDRAFGLAFNITSREVEGYQFLKCCQAAPPESWSHTSLRRPTKASL